MMSEIIHYRVESGAIALPLRPALEDAVKNFVDRGMYHIAVEQHFVEATSKVKKLAADKPSKGKGGAQ